MRGPALALLLLGCAGEATRESVVTATEEPFMERRNALVAQLEREGIADPEVLRAMRTVERHRFVPAELREESYQNHPLPIGSGQTISQPYIVAYMSELARIEPSDRVLEVGTGSGYQLAVLAELLGLGPTAPEGSPRGSLCSIEILPELSQRAAVDLEAAGYRGFELRVGDGYRGWPERAPFDAILVTAAPGRVPEPLKEQLAVGGRLVIPVGEDHQYIELITRRADGSFLTERKLPVRFVPMTGEAERPTSHR